ncbi:Fic family protein [Flavobacterium sp. SM2513]|uniref:Fic family protein n=1 Tax=Flavobacterium sp. SM2513 TaxID=3424766 RepID=UPI003D7FAFA7
MHIVVATDFSPLKTLPKVLSHLNFLSEQQITNSALLAFGTNPQQYFPTAVVKCAHFHGLHVAKPIPDHRVIKGDVFTQVDEAIDFILSKIALAVGMRSHSNQAPLKYEIPRAVIAEAIVNAVAHRDYQSKGSVQLMLFANRVEISNPGALPPELTLYNLRNDHSSYPKNPHLAEVLYQAGYIERFGTGTGEILRLCKEAGLAEPVFDLGAGFKITIWRPEVIGKQFKKNGTDQVNDQVTDQVNELIQRLILITDQAYARQELMTILQLKHNPNFRDNYLNPAMQEGYLSMTLPHKPNSTHQKYQLTAKGQQLKIRLEREEE